MDELSFRIRADVTVLKIRYRRRKIMERLTSNKKVPEMSMYELAHNSCYAKGGKARVRDFDNDLDARELTIGLLEKYASITNEFTCEEDFDDFILDALQYGTDNMLGLIALFYQNLWAMADLRERLKEYEDIGLLPKQILEIDKLYTEKCEELAKLQKEYLSGMELVKIYAGLRKLEEYRKLDEKGRLLKLPCTVGDTVYRISISRTYIDSCQITGFTECDSVKSMCYTAYIDPDEEDIISFSDFGKTVFLTKEEAEAALKGLEAGK